MSKKNESSKGIENVEQTLTKTEQFLEENYKPLLYGLVTIVVVVGLFWLVKIYFAGQNREAQGQMFIAEQYFAQDSLNLALYGDGNNLGFIDVASEYKMTKTGKLANFYAGTCLMHLKDYEQAIDYLDKFPLRDDILAPEAKGMLGDANLSLGNTDKAISLYIDAADMADNSFHSPIYLMKAAEAYMSETEYSKALELYERIKDEYPESNEGRSIDKNIAIVKLLID